MTTLSVTSKDPARLKVDAVVVGVTNSDGGGPRPARGAEKLAAALRGGLVDALTAAGATGTEGEVTRFPTLGAIGASTIVAVGLGEPPAGGQRFEPERLRRAAGAAARALAGTGSAATTLALANGDPSLDDVRAVAEGTLLGAYQFTRYRRAAKPPLGSAALVVADRQARNAKGALERATVVADAVTLCRDLVNTSAADLTPAAFAEAALTACRPLALDIDVLDEKALRKGGYGGILGVGAGSANPPRLVRIAYTHRRAKRTVALVGKGITFDSGGLSLKQAHAMEWMKSDMGGAAAVIATLTAVARLQPRVNVVGWVPTAENMPSGTAIRPSDVLTMYGGRTVEVVNTDAEGRLILADAMVRAAEDDPDVLLDVATLTGAQTVALGSKLFAVMGNDEDLRNAVIAAAGQAGEMAWPMPLPEDLRKSLDSDVADMMNSGDRNGGMLVAGLFLREFVRTGLPWVHLDIAGPAYNQGEPWGYTPRGGTGAAVSTFVEFVESYAG